MTAKPILLSASLAVIVSLFASSARAVELGGQFGFGAGFAAGNTHRQVDTTDPGTGGGLGLDVAARLWLGPVVIGANAMGTTTLIGTNEGLATGNAGLKLDFGEGWRLMPMLEAGRHALWGLGNDLFASGGDGADVVLPCWGARLVLERWKTTPQNARALGVSLFVLADRGRVDTDVQVSGLLDNRTERHRAGGHLVGALFRVMVGS